MTTEKARKSLLLTMLVILLAGAAIWLIVCKHSSAPAIGHVVLISLDTCRADYLSCYGYARPTTPHIDALAGQGYLFSHAMTPIPLTLPAHASMLTGTIPPHHGKHENKDPYFDPSHVTLAALLKTKGYRTGVSSLRGSGVRYPCLSCAGRRASRPASTTNGPRHSLRLVKTA